jgi:hypothetical protein
MASLAPHDGGQIHNTVTVHPGVGLADGEQEKAPVIPDVEYGGEQGGDKFESRIATSGHRVLHTKRASSRLADGPRHKSCHDTVGTIQDPVTYV